MATSIGKLNLQLGASAEDLDKELSDALKNLDKFGASAMKKTDLDLKTPQLIPPKAIELVPGLSEQLAVGVKGFAEKAETAFKVIKNGAALMRGQFDTTGQAMGMLGSIAGAIPGPWGAAGSAILSIGGQVVDYFQGPLLRAQAAARDGFMSVASGAATIPQAMSNIRMEVMQQGLERMVRRTQQGQRQASTLGANMNQTAEQAAAAHMETVNQANLADAGRMAGQIRQRQEEMNRLMRSEPMTRLRGGMATEQATQGLEERAHAPRLALAERTVNRSLRGETGFNEQAVQTSLLTIAMDRFRAQGLTPTANQMVELEVATFNTTRRLREQALALGMDNATHALQTEIATVGLDANALQTRTLRLMGATQAQLRYVRSLQTVRDAGQFTQTLRGQNEALSTQIATFGMSTREAQIHNAVLVRNRLADRASTIADPALRAQADLRVREANAQIEQLRINDEVINQMEHMQRLRQVSTTGSAQVAYAQEQLGLMGAQFRFTVDMSAEEAELQRLRDRGTSAQRIAQQEAFIALTRETRLRTQLAQAGVAAARSVQTPLEQYQESVARAEQLLTSGSLGEGERGLETYSRLVGQAADRLDALFSTEHGGGEAMQAGSASALAAIHRNDRRGGTSGEERAERMRVIMEEMRRQQAEQGRNLRDMATALASGRVLLYVRGANLG